MGIKIHGNNWLRAMKKYISFFALAVLITAVFSCQISIVEEDSGIPEEVLPQEELVLQTYTATTGDVTKTSMDGSGNTVWAAGDQIKIYYTDATSGNVELSDGVNTKNGVFSGMVPAGKTGAYAVYPAAIASSVDIANNKVTVTVPEEQALDAETGGFTTGNIATSIVDAGNNLKFQNVNAFLSVTVSDAVTKVVVESVDGTTLASGVDVTYPADPADPITYSNSGTEYSSITLLLPGEAGTYYFSVVPGTHAKGLKFTYYTGSYTETGSYYLNKSLDIERNDNWQFGAFEPTKDYYVKASGSGGNGLSWSSALTPTQMWNMITLAAAGSDDDKKDALFDAIDGATFHLGAGDYNFGATASLAVSEASTLNLTFMGGYPADGGARDVENNATIFTGDEDADGTGDHRVLTLGGNMNVTFDGISFVKGKVTDENGGALNIANTGTWLFKGCTFSDNEATKDSKNTHGGAIYSAQSIEIEECTMSNNGASYGACVAVSGNGKIAVVRGGTFQNNAAAGNGGAIQVENGAYLEINDDGVLTTNFLNNTAVSYGGALDIETNIKKGETNVIKNAVFKGNQSAYGGAVEVYGGAGKTTKANFNNCTFGGTGDGEPNQSTGDGDGVGGGAFFLEEDVYVVIDGSDFINNSAKKLGGAVFGFGDAHAIINNSKFIGNHGHTGGAIYTEGAPHESPTTFPMFEIDECSFDGNYITSGYGCTININGINSFCMNNTSMRNSYLVKSSKPSGDSKLSWIAIDGIQDGGYSSISNCSIIGDTQYSKTAGGSLSTVTGSSLIWIWGTKTYYFTNSIIVPVDSGVGSITCEHSGATADLAYTHYDDVSATNVVGSNKQDNLTSSSLGSLAWNPSGYWTWDGEISGSSSYPKISASEFSTALSGINSRIVTFLGADINKDQRGEARGSENWWPGAYQN